MPQVAQLWRHPIKSHGREALDSVTLTAGQTMPWDRHWAVTHDATKFMAGSWAACPNFMIGTRTPGLAGLWAALDEATCTVTLRHQSLGTVTFCPDDPAGQAAFLAWISPLCPQDRARPVAVVKGPMGMTDTAFPSISIMNTASHQAVADAAKVPVEPERWRGNIWLDGLDPWAEHGWIGQNLTIGPVVLAVREPIGRCLHTAANPVTGVRDVDTLGTLERSFGHKNFGVYAEVVTGGTIRLGDGAEVT